MEPINFDEKGLMPYTDENRNHETALLVNVFPIIVYIKQITKHDIN